MDWRISVGWDGAFRVSGMGKSGTGGRLVRRARPTGALAPPTGALAPPTGALAPPQLSQPHAWSQASSLDGVGRRNS